MKNNQWIAGLNSLSLNAFLIAIRKPSALRTYLAHCAKKYDEILGDGLPGRSPIRPPAADLSITLPAAHSGGGMSFSEMVVLARATKVLKPRGIFEIGTFNGLTTAIFILNSEESTRIYTLDLPEGSTTNCKYIPSDKSLVANRKLGSVLRGLRLNRYSQIQCDSLQFDPSAYYDSMDLCLVDGAHDLVHVENDTKKVAEMLTSDGIVFWHDYGAKGVMLPLTDYLDTLGKKAEIFRIPETSLAWAKGCELKRAVAQTREAHPPVATSLRQV